MDDRITIGISNGLLDNFQETITRLGITVQEIDEPDGWMDRLTDNIHERKMLKEILSATDSPIKIKHFEMSSQDFNFFRLNVDSDVYKVLK